MDTKSFAVVEFAEDSAVEIIPTSWMEETKEGMFCYWTFTNTRKLVKNRTLPDKAKWRRCPVKKVWLRTDSYTKGLQKCRRVVETSNVETEESTVNKKRAHKKPPRFVSGIDSSSDDDGRVLPKESTNVSKPHPPKYSSFSNPLDKGISSYLSQHSEESLQESQLPITSQPLEVASQLLLEEPQDCATKSYRTKVLQKLQEIAENQQDILTMQRQLLAAVAVTVTEEDGELLENGPCQTVEELQILDRELHNKEKSAKMKNYLRSLGGQNPGATMRKILRKVASNEVLCAYSLKGKKGKLPFQHLNICNIIIGAMQKVYKSLKASEIEDLISMVLKFAPHRHLKC